MKQHKNDVIKCDREEHSPYVNINVQCQGEIDLNNQMKSLVSA